MDNWSSSPDTGTPSQSPEVILWDRIESIINDLLLAHLAINAGKLNLAQTALRNARGKLQQLKKEGVF